MPNCHQILSTINFDIKLLFSVCFDARRHFPQFNAFRKLAWVQYPQYFLCNVCFIGYSLHISIVEFRGRQKPELWSPRTPLIYCGGGVEEHFCRQWGSLIFSSFSASHRSRSLDVLFAVGLHVIVGYYQDSVR